MKKFLFVDLDDTLFQSSSKCVPKLDLRPAAYLNDGLACSFTTQRQREFFELMHREMTMIPATARNRDALGRVSLPFNSYSIIDYGGIVLEPDGSVDPIWIEIMRTRMASEVDGLKEVTQVIDGYSKSAGLQGRARLIEDFEIPFYVVLKDPEKNAKHLEQVEREALRPWLANTVMGERFSIHRNGNNLAVLPKALNKARAVAHVRQRLVAEHGEIMTLGMGDSKSDASFMLACDYAIIPSGTQLAALTLETLKA